MKPKSIVLVVLAFLAAWPAAPAAAGEVKLPAESPAERDARMAWWREARFGLFIHWGVYAVAAGVWEASMVDSAGEWIMNGANIPVDQYEKLAGKFNPVKYDPAAWVRAARDAGMKYIVITSKHHDGFCLFDTRATTWDVVDATPYHQDLLAPLARECRAQGLHFCVYYSIMDWHHPAQYRGSEKQYNPTRIHPEKKAEYMAYMKTQFEELLRICDPEVLWFDGEWPDWFTEDDGREIYVFLRSLKPKIIINNRVGKGRAGMEGLSKGDREYVGDFGTPEQQIPPTGLPGVDWESCMTMNDTWGFREDDRNWKDARTLLRNLIDIASKGGNYLLNVGPTKEGLIPPVSVKRLAQIGKWMQQNGESIHGSKASPFLKLSFGRATRKELPGGNTRLYFHVFEWPAGGKLVTPGLANKPLKAFLLAGGAALAAERAGDAIAITLPKEMPDADATVVVLDIEGPPRVVTQ
jgi:alpha-L-fucosidase